MKNFPPIFDRLTKLRAQHPDRMSRRKMGAALRIGQDYEARYGEAFVALNDDGSLTVGGSYPPTHGLDPQTQEITHIAPNGSTREQIL